MTIADHIRTLAADTLAKLERGSDYFHHTNSAWRLTLEVIGEGRRVDFDNADTGKRVAGPILAKSAQNYVGKYLVLCPD